MKWSCAYRLLELISQNIYLVHLNLNLIKDMNYYYINIIKRRNFLYLGIGAFLLFVVSFGWSVKNKK